MAASTSALVLLTAWWVAPARAGGDKPTAPKFGVQFHGTWSDYTDTQRARVLDVLRRHGATSVRIDVSWRMLQPDGPDSFSVWGLSVVDRAITMAVERGLTPLITLWMAPRWANGSTDERVPPTSERGLAGLTAVAAELAARYRGKVIGWEIWNEPNSEDFMRGASPEVYARVLRAASAGIRAGDPSARVVFGGPMYVDDRWVARALSAGAAGHYDVMGVHPYSGVGDEAPNLPDDGTPWRMRHLPALRAVMADHGDGDKPIWFTEFGWRVGPNPAGTPNWQRGVTAGRAAEYLRRTFDLIRAEWPYVERVYWYRDRADSADPERAGYGLVLPDGSAMPALALAGRLAAGASGVQTTVKVSPRKGRSRLHVDVDPDLARGNLRFRVQRKTAHGGWVTKGRTYRTKGRSERRTLNLPRGTYRVLVPAQRGRPTAISAQVRLLR